MQLDAYRKKLRLIVDLRPLNGQSSIFCQETIDMVCELVEFDDHFVSIDLKSVFIIFLLIQSSTNN